MPYSLRTFTDCYVLMLTARTDEVDRIVGLSVGADDYITKPFSPRELVARVRRYYGDRASRPSSRPGRSRRARSGPSSSTWRAGG